MMTRESREAQKAQKAAAHAAMVNPFKVGDILNYSWGYDQTNLEFFQVVAVKPKSLIMRRIASEPVPGSQGFMCQSCVPVPNAFLESEPAVRKPLQPYVNHDGTLIGEGVYIPMKYGWISRWNGAPQGESWYA